jgi:hypothetical protein
VSSVTIAEIYISDKSCGFNNFLSSSLKIKTKNEKDFIKYYPVLFYYFKQAILRLRPFGRHLLQVIGMIQQLGRHIQLLQQL